MITSVDTNVLIGLFSGPPPVARAIRVDLEELSRQDILVVSPPVYAELLAAPGRKVDDINTFLRRNHIEVDWFLDPAIWETAGLAYQQYSVARRRLQPADSGPRRILADFVIGAHALHAAASLLTLDQRIYRTAFPELTILTPKNL